jgi:hypothetical protein
MSKQAADHHRKAAEHHESAARHHGEAATHHDAGDFVQALCAVPAMNRRSRALVTTNDRQLGAVLLEDSEVIDTWGTPEVRYQVVIDIEGATLRRRGHVAT